MCLVGYGPDHDKQVKWDKWFLGMAEYVSTGSKDPSTQVGAVIVRPDKTVLSTGFNGFPRGVNDAPDLLADREKKYARIIHAEMNAILLSHDNVRGCTLYTFPLAPCERCAVHVIQAGIVAVVCPVKWGAELAGRWQTNLAAELFKEAGVEVRLVDFHA